MPHGSGVERFTGPLLNQQAGQRKGKAGKQPKKVMIDEERIAKQKQKKQAIASKRASRGGSAGMGNVRGVLSILFAVSLGLFACQIPTQGNIDVEVCFKNGPAFPITPEDSAAVQCEVPDSLTVEQPTAE